MHRRVVRIGHDHLVAERLQVAGHPPAPHVSFVEKHVVELAAATQKMIVRHKHEILHRQLVVERLAAIAIELYARLTTISRTQRLIDERGVDACAREIALTQLFCMQSGRRFRALRMELERDAGESIDELRQSIASTIRGDAGYGSDDALMDVPVPPLPAWSLTKAEQERRAGVLSDVHVTTPAVR